MSSLLAILLLSFALPFGLGCGSSNNDTAVAGDSKPNLANANLHVNFELLTVGDAVILTAPDPTAEAALVFETLSVQGAILSQDCSCQWTVGPDEIASFAPDDSCSTVMTIIGASCDSRIAVQVDCGDLGRAIFEQDLCTGLP